MNAQNTQKSVNVVRAAETYNSILSEEADDWGIQSWCLIFLFSLAVENLQFNCDQYNRTNSSENGLSQHVWLKQNPSKDFSITILISAVRFIKRIPEGQEKKCEEGNIKCNIENVPKGQSIHSNQINIWNVNSEYHTTTDHTKRHTKIHSIKNPYNCSLYAKKIHLQEQNEESCLRKSKSLYCEWKGSHIKEPLKETQ